MKVISLSSRRSDGTWISWKFFGTKVLKNVFKFLISVFENVIISGTVVKLLSLLQQWNHSYSSINPWFTIALQAEQLMKGMYLSLCFSDGTWRSRNFFDTKVLKYVFKFLISLFENVNISDTVVKLLSVLQNRNHKMFLLYR